MIINAIIASQSQSASRDASGRLTSELTGTKHELLKIQEMLEMAERVSSVI